uniref:Calmodulin-lysine N-methyltransferase n=1 Tax=Odontella aurita TaxID=265563 RepID=A0A7S4NC71_9STRA
MPKSPAHPPLPLSELRTWIPSDKIYRWLEEGDKKAAAFQEELDDAGAGAISDLFAGGGDDEDSSDASTSSEADYEGLDGRVLVWNSAGAGGGEDGDGDGDDVDGKGEKYRGVQLQDDDVTEDGSGSDGSVRVVYVKSDSWEGYGEMLWASARHLANLFADPHKCRELLSPLWNHRQSSSSSSEGGSPHAQRQHPLSGLRVLELGAGCGVPSLVALKRGARVVCTDLDDANRIRSIAESMELNRREISTKGGEKRYPEFGRSRACPFRWGESSAAVAQALDPKGMEKFDVICAADCLFMTHLHYDILRGIDELLAQDGVAIIAFAIHEAYSKDEEVWPFVDKAKEKGFDVEVMEGVQLTPPTKGMEAKQGLIHKLRMTRS